MDDNSIEDEEDKEISYDDSSSGSKELDRDGDNYSDDDR